MSAMMKHVIFLTVLMSFAALADSPLPPPQAWRMCDIYIKYCASLDPDKGISVFEIVAPFTPKEIYKIPGWSRSARISSDGVYFVAGGGTLISKDSQTDFVMFVIL